LADRGGLIIAGALVLFALHAQNTPAKSAGQQASLVRSSSKSTSSKYGVCPVQGGAKFSDTWGAPRSGGRRHKGVDMFAPVGRPVVAITDVRVIRVATFSLGGLTVLTRDGNGTDYYYAHLLRVHVAAGQMVRMGQVLGQVGKTGNAQYTPPHLHFEVRPHGQAVNPTPYVRDWCQ
jgi:peptidoglycan LD-endopeptidase LytH